MKKSYYNPPERICVKKNINIVKQLKYNDSKVKVDENGMENIDEFWEQAGNGITKSETDVVEMNTDEYYKLVEMHKEGTDDSITTFKSTNFSLQKNNSETSKTVPTQEIKKPMVDDDFNFTETDMNLSQTFVEHREDVQFDNPEEFAAEDVKSSVILDETKKVTEKTVETQETTNAPKKDASVKRKRKKFVPTPSSQCQVLNFSQRIKDLVSQEIDFKHGPESYSNTTEEDKNSDNKDNNDLEVKNEVVENNGDQDQDDWNEAVANVPDNFEEELEAEIDNFNNNFDDFSDESIAAKFDRQNTKKNENPQTEKNINKTEEDMARTKVLNFSPKPRASTPKKTRKSSKTTLKPIEIRKNKDLLAKETFSDVLDNKFETPRKQSNLRKKKINKEMIRERINFKKKDDNLLRSFVAKDKIKRLPKENQPQKITRTKRTQLKIKKLPINKFFVADNNENYEENILTLNNGAYTELTRAETEMEVFVEKGKICVTVKRSENEYGSTDLDIEERILIHPGDTYQITNRIKNKSRVQMLFYK